MNYLNGAELEGKIKAEQSAFCLRCPRDNGKCCHSVHLTDQDIDRIQSLGFRKNSFAKADVIGSSWIKCMKVGAKTWETHCVFLEDGKCSIYNNRPEICRRYLCYPLEGHLKEMFR